MSKYRKKPIVVDAYQFKGVFADGVIKDAPQWVQDGYYKGDIKVAAFAPNDIVVISTSNGAMRVDLDDWIIKGVMGELYPCKPDVFAMSYENV